MSNTLRVKVYIDGTYVECVEQPEVVISYDAELTRSVEKARDGRMVSFKWR